MEKNLFAEKIISILREGDMQTHRNTSVITIHVDRIRALFEQNPYLKALGEREYSQLEQQLKEASEARRQAEDAARAAADAKLAQIQKAKEARITARLAEEKRQADERKARIDASRQARAEGKDLQKTLKHKPDNMQRAAGDAKKQKEKDKARKALRKAKVEAAVAASETSQPENE